MDRYTIGMFVIGSISVFIFFVAEMMKHLEARKREVRSINYLRFLRQQQIVKFEDYQPGNEIDKLLYDEYQRQKGTRLQ